MSEWPTPVGPTARTKAAFFAADVIEVTMINPTEGATITTAEFTVEWTFAPGVQATYRVEIFSDALGTLIVFDTGIVASAASTHVVPAGALDNATTLYARVSITTTAPQAGESPLTSFITAFAPSVNIVPTLLLVGGSCPGSGADILPCIRVLWTQVVPGAGETFIQYDVKRREAGETTWTRIATITTIGTVQYDDCNVKPFQTYEYSVVWQANTASGILVSTDPTTPPFERQEFDFLFLHDVAVPTNFARFNSHVASEELIQDISFRPVWGRQPPTAHVGETEFHRLTVDGLPDLFRGDQWTDIEALVSRQRTDGAILCARLGRAGELFFCQLSGESKDHGQKTLVPRIELEEVFFQEAV